METKINNYLFEHVNKYQIFVLLIIPIFATSIFTVLLYSNKAFAASELRINNFQNTDVDYKLLKPNGDIVSQGIIKPIHAVFLGLDPFLTYIINIDYGKFHEDDRINSGTQCIVYEATSLGLVTERCQNQVGTHPIKESLKSFAQILKSENLQDILKSLLNK